MAGVRTAAALQFSNCSRVDKLVRVDELAHAQRCLLAEDTSAPWENLFELPVDATSWS